MIKSLHYVSTYNIKFCEDDDEENEEEVGGFNREDLESRLTGKAINPSTFPNFDLLRGGTAEDVTLYNSALPMRATEYVLEKLVGGGDDGLVYQAYKKGRPAKKYAIKIMTWIVDIDGRMQVAKGKEILREALILKALNERGAPVPKWIETFVAVVGDGPEMCECSLFVMEMAQGSVEKMMEVNSERATLSPVASCVVGHQIITALEYLHTFGKVHHDLKLINMLVTMENRVVLNDFAQVRTLPEDNSEKAVICGQELTIFGRYLFTGSGDNVAAEPHLVEGLLEDYLKEVRDAKYYMETGKIDYTIIKGLISTFVLTQIDVSY
ncbi:protein kinase domain-containing protein [Ditylenchus destructor]|uniref:Protein kinase domain-containing protein n=1 Tax=Ditylenchus destructor TaxID=166010 RepID=A0AAD4R5D1_9BILA|nr:protein kinase domain-containing protein [Ditylenchus destructor]